MAETGLLECLKKCPSEHTGGVLPKIYRKKRLDFILVLLPISLEGCPLTGLVISEKIQVEIPAFYSRNY